MTDFDQTKIRRLDLTVLLIFLGLVRTRKASAVASDLGLTSSSISHALRRLRDIFDDDLFIRRPHGLEPTAFALAIEPDVRRSVDALQAALSGPAAFEPLGATGTLRLAANDRETATHVLPAFQQIAAQAPGIDVSVRSASRADALRELEDGSLDFAIGFFRKLGPRFDSARLQTESYLVAASAEHDLWECPLTPQRYTACRHLLVSSDGSMKGIVDTVLEGMGLNRRVCLASPSFLAALSVLSDSDLIATLPKGLVQQYATTFGLRSCDPPIPIRAFDISLVSHRRNRKNPLHQWVLRMFTGVRHEASK
ncbi:MAG: LysR family transcriptional regulator [Pseudomonadota bacterium]